MADELTRARMRSDWDERARENAYHYIASEREDWDEEEFYASGRASVREIVLDDAERVFGGRDPGSVRAIEIGCGAGRMTRALAEELGEVHGVDVSAEMIERARVALADRPNAHVHLSDGAGLADVPQSGFQLALSYIVFQHIPSPEAIEGYFREAAARLEPGGVFKMQTQGSPLALLGKQDTWEGCYVSAATWLVWSRKYGYRLLDFEGAGTQYLWLWWERADGGEPSARELRFLDAERRAFEDLLRSFAARIQQGEQERESLRAEQAALLEERNELRSQAEAGAAQNEQLAAELETTRAQRDEEAARVKEAHQALLAVYRSPAYRVGRRLGLAPERIG